MERKMSTYYSEKKNGGHATVYFDFKEEMASIRYYDDQDHMFYVEEFPNKSLRYVEDAAENWAMGIKVLEPSYH